MEYMMTLFTGCDYTGDFIEVRREPNQTLALNLTDINNLYKNMGFCNDCNFNDKTSSLMIPPNSQVMLYEHDNYQGKILFIDNASIRFLNLNCLIKLNFDKSMSSLIFRPSSFIATSTGPNKSIIQNLSNQTDLDVFLANNKLAPTMSNNITTPSYIPIPTQVPVANSIIPVQKISNTQIGVTFYFDIIPDEANINNYKGISIDRVANDRYKFNMQDMINLGIPNDSVSAIVINPNTAIVLCQHAGFEGRGLFINNTNNKGSLIIRNLANFNFNKEISSFLIRDSISTMSSGVLTIDSMIYVEKVLREAQTCSQIKEIETLVTKEGFKTTSKYNSNHYRKNDSNNNLLYLIAFIIVLF